MTEEQRKAIEELIRVVQVATFTARGLWFFSKRGSPFGAAMLDIETRLDVAVAAVQDVLAKQADSVQDGTVH